MRAPHAEFVQGLGTGLALAGVAFFLVGAVRRFRALRHEHAGRIHIDGTERVDPLYRPVGAPPEVDSASETLASEIPDFAPISQRW